MTKIHELLGATSGVGQVDCHEDLLFLFAIEKQAIPILAKFAIVGLVEILGADFAGNPK
jgi:hypothetical protein